MATVTPRRSMRISLNHTPKMSERKKGLFQGAMAASMDSLTHHRRLPVLDSESDTDECDLGIISTLDSSSGDELNEPALPKTPENKPWHETRSQTKRLLKDSCNLKNFIKSPFTLNKYQSRYCPDSKSNTPMSTPATPHVSQHPGTPSSSHSCTSVHTTSSTSSRARKSLASLIADTESCSSSLKDLNFDSESGADSKENTPTKSIRKSTRKIKTTPKFASFKGILVEQKKNMLSPIKLGSPVVCLTKMEFTSMVSPTQMLKTPDTTSENTSPPKLGHNRRPIVEIAESPENSSESEKCYKRLRNDSLTEYGPSSKCPKLDFNQAPKARLSLFSCDKLKEILSAKSFYGKSSQELNTSFSNKLANAIVATVAAKKTVHANKRRSRKPGQINLGVKHKIRKPKMNKRKSGGLNKSGKSANSTFNNSALTNSTANNSTMLTVNSSQEMDDKADPFGKEKQTIESLLSQWTEEEIPEKETYKKPQDSCFDKTLMEENDRIFGSTAIPVQVCGNSVPDSEVIVELGKAADVTMMDSHVDVHGTPQTGFLPVEGGYIVVEDKEKLETSQEIVPDLDEIERELRMLDEQILKMAESNNINAEAVIASTEKDIAVDSNAQSEPCPSGSGDKSNKLFAIFSNPNPGMPSPVSKSSPMAVKKSVLKSVSGQYVIDAGQTKFGITQCPECEVIYEIGDPEDEHDHLVHHNATDILKYNGVKDELVVGRWGAGRVVAARGGGTLWGRVVRVLEGVVHPQLGYEGELDKDRIYAYTAYLYVEKRQIIGCLIMEPKVKAYKLIPGDPDCCSVEEYPVKCGVSRIWTHKSHRRLGIARRMLDCARATFYYGAALTPQEVSFSAPTELGKTFASKYTGLPDFYVYLN